MFFPPWIKNCSWALPIALVGVIPISSVFAYGTNLKRFEFPMVVVEPVAAPHQGTSTPSPLNLEMVSTQRPNRLSNNGNLTQQEVTRALVFRMNTQRALRNLKARRLALHRHQGVKAWRREMEVYLAAQKQLKANPPQVKPPSVGNPLRPAPDGRSPRKSNSVLA